jgi:hypothetical protein
LQSVQKKIARTLRQAHFLHPLRAQSVIDFSVVDSLSNSERQSQFRETGFESKQGIIGTGCDPTAEMHPAVPEIAAPLGYGV